MNRLCAASSLVVCILLTGSAWAEGLLYKLADDGGWAKFEINAKAVDPDGTEKTTLSGALTISSVGRLDVDGQPCRWIELAFNGKRNEQMFTGVDKLLIPEKHLAKGEDPLKHVLKAWRRHSKSAGGLAIEIPDVQKPEGIGAEYLRDDRLRQFLHGPFEASQNLDKALVEGKFGKLECDGISAQERRTGEVLRDSKYVIRLHKDVPFGVVTWEAEMKFEQDQKPLVTLATKATLLEFGKDAKSSIPDAR